MGNQFQFDKPYNMVSGYSISNSNDSSKKRRNDEDLIIEENTIYEIDRECYERLKRQRKRKIQEKRNI